MAIFLMAVLYIFRAPQLRDAFIALGTIYFYIHYSILSTQYLKHNT